MALRPCSSEFERYAQRALKMIRDGVAPYTRKKATWGVTRAALRWLSKEIQTHFPHHVDIHDRTEQLLRSIDPFPSQVRVDGETVKEPSNPVRRLTAMRIAGIALAQIPNWRERMWEGFLQKYHEGGEHLTAVATLMSVPLRPADFEKPVQIHFIPPERLVLEERLKHPLGVIELEIAGSKRDNVVIPRSGEKGATMIRTGEKKGQQWRVLWLSYEKLPWLTHLRDVAENGTGRAEIDYRRKRHITNPLEDVGEHANLGVTTAAFALRHCLMTELRSGTGDLQMTEAEIAMAAGHSSADTQAGYGTFLRGGTPFNPRVKVQAAENGNIRRIGLALERRDRLNDLSKRDKTAPKTSVRAFSPFLPPSPHSTKKFGGR